MGDTVTDKQVNPSPLSEVGVTGLFQFGGYSAEEKLPQLYGTKAVRTYREMADNDAVFGAVFFAIQMAVTAKYGRKMDINVITFWMFVGNGVLSLISSLLFETQAPLSVWTPNFICVMAFLSVGCTCVALLIQNVGLAHVPASTGSLLLSMESPSGVLFSVLLMGEALTSRLLAGFVLIFLSIILSETHFDFLRRKPRPQL